MRKGRYAKGVTLLLVASMGFLAFGCYGKFQLTRNLHDVNQSVEDPYLRSAVTWLFVIPYALTGILDFTVFNLIEFWSGENPIDGASAKVTINGDGTAAMTVERQGKATVATVETFKGGALLSTLSIRDEGRGLVTSEFTIPGRGTVRTTAARLPDGSVEVTTLSRSGSKTERHPATEVEAYFARATRIAAELRPAGNPPPA